MMNAISKESDSALVNSLLHLIRQQDIEGLRKALLTSIHDYEPDCKIFLYEQGYGIFNAKDKPFSPVLIASYDPDQDETILNPLKSASFQFEGFDYLPTEDYVQVFNVEGDRSSRGLLVTVNQDFIEEDFIDILLDAYNHQIQLLRNKDTDYLTGLFNRQYFQFKLQQIHQSYTFNQRKGDTAANACFVLIDIDYFKKVNDKYGHVYGDEVLLIFSEIMKNTFRDNDLIFRYGGEEFSVLLQNVDITRAEKALERFRSFVENHSFPMQNAVTTSIGFTSFGSDIPLSTIIEHADKALYYSKEHGRNKVSCYERLLSENKVAETQAFETDIELF